MSELLRAISMGICRVASPYRGGGWGSRDFLATLCRLVTVASAVAFHSVAAHHAAGQGNVGANRRGTTPGRPRGDDGRTQVFLEILTGSEGVGVQVQAWQASLRESGAIVRIRSGGVLDKVETRERKMGTLRQVTAVGRLSRAGTLTFADRTFTRNDGAKLKEWVADLRNFGAQGAPEGKPLWGLTDTKFDTVRSQLAKPVMKSTQGLELDATIAATELPVELPTQITTDAADWLKVAPVKSKKFRQELKGLAKGTAFAILLNEYGLGFYPRRLPDGSIELSVQPLTKIQTPWPIGWELKESRLETAPKLFKIEAMEVDGATFYDVLLMASEKAALPIFIDHYRVEATVGGLDLSKVMVKYPAKKTSWSVFIRDVAGRKQLSTRLLVDESGKPFIWITPFPRSRG